MMAVLAGLVCGAFVFVEQDIPGLRVGRAEPYSGSRWRNFRQADMDGDGEIDLILPDSVAFQREGDFRPENRHALPYLDENPACDVWDATLYLRISSGLVCVRWTAEGWKTLEEHPLEWPEADPVWRQPAETASHGAPAAHFERFLYDLDGSGRPEVIVAGEDGLHVFANPGDGYAPAGLLDILPPPKLVPGDPSPFWPPDTRRIPSLEMQLSCRLFITQNTATTIESDHLPDGHARHRIRRYLLEQDDSGRWGAALAEMQETPLMGADMRPCRLDDNGRIDFAGGRWHFAPGGLMQAPVFETRVSTDGGHTFQFVRSVSFRPSCSFTDFNGNGRLDMVTESSGLFAGGVRETVSRLTSARSVEHSVRIHLQDAEGGFPQKPDVSGTFRLDLDKAPMRGGDRFRRYQASELIDVTGDFDGDGIRDIVVHEDAHTLRVYRGTPNGFETRPMLTAKTEPHWRFAVADIDGDGRSDIVFRWMDPESTDGFEQTRVLLTREETP